MSANLDLGTLWATVDLNTVAFDVKYAAVLRKFADLGVQADRAAVQTGTFDKSLSGVGKASGVAAFEVSRAAEAMRSTTAAATQATARTTELGAAQSKATQATLRQTAAQARLNALQETGKASTAQLASAQAALIAANDRVALSQERLAKATTFAQRYHSLAGPLAAVGAVIAAGFYEAGKAAVDFDAKMALNTSLLRASSKSTQELAGWMGQLRHAALTVGQQYGYTASQVADAEGELIKAGVSVKDILGGALTGALTLAAAGQMDVAQATETAAIAMTQFKLKGSDVPHIADLLAAGADRALGSVADLSEALKTGGLAASQAGESIDNTIGTLAEFAQAGLMGSSAGSAMSMMLQNLQKPSATAAAMMDRYNISLYNANGTTKTYTQLAGDLHNNLASLPPAERSAALATLFTARARRAATILTLDGAKANAEWTRTVDAQGFAALQAAGKLNSLAGDWTKLKAAISTALIGTGQDAQNPLRSLTQDATGVVKAWNNLPGPVKAATLALTAVTAAAALAGAAALVLIPKLAATKAALTEMGLSAEVASTALGTLGKAALVIPVIAGLEHGIHSLTDKLGPAAPNIDALGNALVDFGMKGKVAGELSKDFGANLSDLDSELRRITDPSLNQQVMDTLNKIPLLGSKAGSLKNAQQDFAALDQSLAALATGGHTEVAAAAFQQLAQRINAAGGSTKDLAGRLPKYGQALSDIQSQAKLTGHSVDQYGNATDAAARKTKTATEIAQKYADTLHAATDPIFAMNQALQDLRAKQTAASAATRKYGADSGKAKQANDDLFQSMINAQGAAGQLSSAFKDGSVSMHGTRVMVDAFKASMGLTTAQAKFLVGQVQGLIDKSNHLNHLRPNLNIGAHTDQAQSALDSLEARLRSLASHVWSAVVEVFTHGSTSTPTPPTGRGRQALGHAAGGLISGAGSGTSDSIPALLSNGEFVMPADRTARYLPLLEAIRAGRIVDAALAAAVAPAITDPSALSGLLSSSRGTAVAAQQASDTAHAIYRQAAQDLNGLKRANSEAEAAAKRHAQALSNEAHKAHELAANMSGSTKAAAAAKHAAEEHARSLDAEARAASQAATKIAAADSKREQSATKTAQKAKQAWTAAASAAQQAAQAAENAAQQLVTSLQGQLDTLAQQVNDFTSSISAGLTGDDSLSTIWQSLTDAATNSATALASAQQTLTDAQNAVTGAGGGATADQIKALADAQAAYNTALADYNRLSSAASTGGVQSSLDQVLASAQQFAGDLQTLIGEGATQTLISQLVAMGPQAGDALASQLVAAGPDSVAKLSATLDQIASYTKNAADQMAQTFFGGGVSAMEQFIAGLISQFPALSAALAPVLSQLQGLFAGASGSASAATGGPAHGLSSVDFGGVLPGFASGVTNFVGGWAMVGENGPEVLRLPRGSSVYPRGSDGAAAMTATLHPDDRALLRAVAAQMEARPVQLLVDHNGRRVIGEVANDHRQFQRELGNPDYR